MPRFYLLRLYSTGELFAGFAGWKPAGKHIYEPVFVKPDPGKPVQAQVIHEDDIEETEKDLRNLNYRVDRVQVT